MYTFNPIPAIDTINNHAGFYLICGICAVIILFTFAVSDYMEEFRWPFIICLAVMGISAGISYNTGEYREYANTKVEGKFIGFHSVSERHGKTTRMVDKHYTYVEYEVEGNRVLFRGATGTVYPKIAVLYKN